MTETDQTVRPLRMPEKFIPYLDRYRIYKFFKDMVQDIVINLPRDHVVAMKVYITRKMNASKDSQRLMVLVNPELKLDSMRLVKELIKDLGLIAISRRCVMDRYQADEEYKPGCVSLPLMSEVTKRIARADPVATAGWLMFDHPCTVREARCLQQDGVLPTVTLLLTLPPPLGKKADNTATAARGFNDQDFEGLKYVYKATLKVVYVEPEDDIVKISNKCFNAIMAFQSGSQGPDQRLAVGAPSVYRVLMIGPRGSGRKTQARMLAKHFGLVYIDFQDLQREARKRSDEVGQKLRNYSMSVQLKAEIVFRRLLMKDCIACGWVMTGFPTSGVDFEKLDSMETPPNRIIILNAERSTCRERAMHVCVDWCTGKRAPFGSGPRVLPHPGETEDDIDGELEYYFTEALAELRAAAGFTAVELNTEGDTIDQTQVKIHAAVIAAPAFDLISGSKLKDVCGD